MVNVTSGSACRMSGRISRLKNMTASTFGSQSIDLMGLRFINGLTWTFDSTAGIPRLLPPGQRALIVGHQAAFNLRHGPGLPVAGQFTGQLSNAGEQLTLTAASGAVIRDFTWSDLAPWPVAADGAGPSLVLIQPLTNPDHTLPTSWRASAGTGNPGTSDAQNYASWKAANAPGQGDISDMDNDGVSLFWEYLLGGQPGPANTSLLPTAGLMNDGVNTYQTLTATLRTGTDDVAIEAEASTQLQAWDAAACVLVSRTWNADGTETVVYRHIHPWLADQRVFLRLHGTAK